MKKESNIQAQIQLALSEHGIVSFRNNIGSAVNPHNGNYVQYGVGGVGGADLICIIPTVITPDMVGQTIGVFGAIEVKTAIGRPSKDQLRFLEIVKQKAGYSGIARSVEDAYKIAKIGDAVMRIGDSYYVVDPKDLSKKQNDDNESSGVAHDKAD